ncbi:uncharacterized protein DC041_0006487 [Schistosoma bovis]|uniref:Uncharacterized protein n=1 Tax=Schistosoma bovis TaxID=6184 RepID=A0A430QMQ9_SCHBO|nr:uncharacterized protein DC041_0006487 [Schistosoma bovis]
MEKIKMVLKALHHWGSTKILLLSLHIILTYSYK